jgi:hypothetical protein
MMPNIEVEDYLDEVSDEALKREITKRGIPTDAEPLLLEAYSALVACKDIENALTLMERALFPTHRDQAHVLWKYNQRMGRL